MNKSPFQLGSAILILGISISTFGFALTASAQQQTTTTTTEPASTTYQPTTTTTTTPTAGTYDPAVLQGPSAGGVPIGTVSTTQPAPTTTTTQPTATVTPAPTSTYVPPRYVPPRTVIPPVVPTTPTCPAVENPVTPVPECPAPVAPLPIIPQLPYVLVFTPILAVLLFWFVLGSINRSQLKSEGKVTALHLQNAHRQTVSADRDKTYRQLLDFLTMELSSSHPFNPHTYQHLSSKIELLGSVEMQGINQRIGEAFHDEDRPKVKALLKDLAAQIKKESA